MDTMQVSNAISPKLLAAAPHRLLFFVGAGNVLLAMAWWALWLADARWQLIGLSQPQVYGGWLHAIVMQYQVLAPFMFGFLLTVFPRWMGQPDLTRWHYVPVGLGLFGGQLLTLAGAFGPAHLLHIGAVMTLVGWGTGLFFLLRLLWRDRGKTWHAVSCGAAMTLGFAGFALYALFLHVYDTRLMFAAIKLGSFGLLLPVYFTVAHRMFPFFAGNVVRGHRGWRPLWVLGAFWPLVLLHLGLELAHGYAWLWLADLPLLALAGTWLWRNWPHGPAPRLLRVLFLGYLWLPLAMALYALQSILYASSGSFLLGRAPAHALFIGFFGSLLVAMVTRVTQGHAGRPLVFGGVATFAFATIQLVCLTRIAAELAPDQMAWHIAAAAGWLLAFAPWVLRSLWIYLTPRVDGRSG
ncbi:NnrS family protein [Cognatiluteimonas weifangensis]|uniref:NnrS family protein n=1 Tax=Cognatiluteimonas weifangensis TaxID=2303539 RepID=A0A372DNP9_9GAMM|nr:NnrS family protein [Luteimonas weifangensis]RFP61139.1 NnrS family protein [Luteimonas weifangensis]